MNQNKDTIRIKSTKDYEWEAGDSFTITLAANSLEGNKDLSKNTQYLISIWLIANVLEYLLKMVAM